MPYIKSNDSRREKLRNGEPALTAGELNYQIFYYVKHHACHLDIERAKREIDRFVIKFLGDKPNYQKYNDMTGALLRCDREIKRRLKIKFVPSILINIMNSYDDEIAKYEDLKCIQNGDVE